MAFSDFDKAVGVILKHEGGLANNPNDPGGITNFGISMRFALQDLQGDLDQDGFKDGDFDHDGDIDADDIKNMKVGDAIRIYKQYWWDKYHYELITGQDAATKVMDCCVNMGPAAHKLVQRACNDLGVEPRLVVDGQLGSKSFSAINSFDEVKFLAALCKQQKQFYDRIIVINPKLEVFRYGWYKRAKWPFAEMPA
jgi:lysozyme family protein